MKKYIMLGMALGLAMAGCSGPQAAVKSATAEAVAVSEASASIAVVEHVKESKNDCVDIRFVYPTVGDARIDAQIEAFIKDYDANMAQEVVPLCEELAGTADENEGMRYSYGVWYDVIRADAGGVDLLFYFQSYTGGAHDALALETMSFDTKTGARLDPLSLVDADEAKALERLSAVSRAKLPEKLTDFEDVAGMIQAGTEPERDNFRNVVRTETGVRVYFDPYAVAPWAAGILFVDVD